MAIYWRGPEDWEDRRPKTGEKPRGSYWLKTSVHRNGVREVVRESLETTEEKEAARRAVLRERDLQEDARNPKVAQADPQPGATVGELVDAWFEHCGTYYRKLGELTSTMGTCKAVHTALTPYRDLPTTAFDSALLLEVQAAWVKSRISWKTVNAYHTYLVRCFKWGIPGKLVKPETVGSLSAVEKLREGRSEAVHYDAIPPVDEDSIKKTKEKLPQTIRDMIDLQLLTGARPGEVCMLKPFMIDKSDPELWVADISKWSKLAHKNKDRFLWFGPKSREILTRRMTVTVPGADNVVRPRRRDESFFTPQEAEAERNIGKAHRRGDQQESKRTTDRVWSDGYSERSYRQAVQRAAVKAEIAEWEPNQLRHNAATRLYEEFGGNWELIRQVLGHSKISTTVIYVNKTIDAAKAAVGDKLKQFG